MGIYQRSRPQKTPECLLFEARLDDWLAGKITEQAEPALVQRLMKHKTECSSCRDEHLVREDRIEVDVLKRSGIGVEGLFDGVRAINPRINPVRVAS